MPVSAASSGEDCRGLSDPVTAPDKSTGEVPRLLHIAVAVDFSDTDAVVAHAVAAHSAAVGTMAIIARR